MSESANTFACAEALLANRRVADALRLFSLAEDEGYDADQCAAGCWLAAMLFGDYLSAWRASDAIRRRGKPDPNRLWQGEELRGQRIVLRCLHGLGDAIQFLRYAPLLRMRAAHLVVECAPSAAALVRCMPGVEDVITWGLDAPATPPQWDVQLEVMELPYIFRTTLTDLPLAVNYLSLPQGTLDRAALIVGSKTGEPRIGVVWSSGEWNPARSLPLRMLLPILGRTECQFWNLQGGAMRSEWKRVPLSTHLHDAPVLADGGILPLAAVIAQLDLVVTVDTLAAHLAGALNIPCFLLLQYAADWRWMVDRDDSPWYPSLRLFRQPAPGDWAAAVSELDRALEIFVAAKMPFGVVG